jgi:hypothetical protein
LKGIPGQDLPIYLYPEVQEDLLEKAYFLNERPY